KSNLQLGEAATTPLPAVRLAQSARHWSEHKTISRLPTISQLLRFHLTTSRQLWTQSEKQFIQAAVHFHANKLVFLSAMFLVLIGISWKTYGNIVAKRNDELVARIGNAPKEALIPLTQQLLVAGGEKLGMLKLAFRQAQQNQDASATFNYSLALDEFGIDQTPYVCQRLLDATASEMAPMMELVDQSGILQAPESRRLLWDALEEPGAGDTACTPLWPLANEGAIRKIQNHDGRITPAFAWCPSLPFDDFQMTCEALRSSKYRVHRARPYIADNTLRVATIWRRDTHPWRIRYALPASELIATIDEFRAENFQLYDLAGYQGPNDKSTLFIGVWLKAESPETEVDYLFDSESADHAKAFFKKSQAGFSPFCHSSHLDRNGDLKFSSLWLRAPQVKPVATYVMDEFHPDYFGDLNGIQDIAVSFKYPKPTRDRFVEQLRMANELLVAGPNANAQFLKGRALYYLDQNEDAAQFLTPACESVTLRLYALPMRACVLARLGQREDALRDLDQFHQICKAKSGWKQWRQAYFAATRAKVLYWLGEPSFDDDLQVLLRKNPTDANTCFYSACTYAAISATDAEGEVAAEGQLSSDGQRSEHLALAAKLLQDSIDLGLDRERIARTPDLKKLHSSFSIFDESRLSFSCIWNIDDKATRLLLSMRPQRHRQNAKMLGSAGFLPQGIAVGFGDTAEITSVWSKPQWQETQQRALERRCNAASVLTRLGENEAWETLAGDSEAFRGEFVWRAVEFGLRPKQILDRFDTRISPSEIRTLLLILGEYERDELPTSIQAELERVLCENSSHAEAGVRSAVNWLLNRWNMKSKVFQDPPENANWWINSIGLTMIKMDGPDKFLTGSAANEPERLAIENLQTDSLEYSFALSAKEITQQQFEMFTSEFQKDGSAKNPVRGISWFQAAAFCNWLSKKEGIDPDDFCYKLDSRDGYGPGMTLKTNIADCSGYRLPTESEWEFACRAGSSGSYSFGDTPQLLSRYGNVGAWPSKLMEGGRLRPNAFGFFDMHGNVLEWVHNPMLASGSIETSSLRKHNEIAIDLETKMIVRGGSYGLGPEHARSAARLPIDAKSKFQHGFRVARTVH
ncbi:MAG: formylglycine-generating enzyme family protein, partial [Planctomycetota bacterium]